MPRAQKKTIVPAPQDQVFDYVSTRANAESFVPSLKVHDVVGPDGLGQRWQWEYRVLGIPVRGEAEMVAFDPPHAHTFKTTGMVPSTWTYAVAPVDAQSSELTLTVDYELPDSILGRLADALAVGPMNEAQADRIVANVREHFTNKGAS
ncbi:MAG TPA: SRPBCC family protein [Tepidisphaeraceae bacterium]|nr:SRPBCC family protein [Tepidisphaeraceae bacterium]